MASAVPPTVVDLFCGAGGFSLGFSAAGCQIVAGVDRDEDCAATFAENFGRLQPGAPPCVLGGDEGDLERDDFTHITEGSPDILIGGPPCQGFSRIGRAKLDSVLEDAGEDGSFADDPRNELYRRFLDAAAFWKPKVVVMENVPGMMSVKGVNVADQAGWELGQRGYRVGYAVLNAVWYGVPQYRERLFLVGIRRDIETEPHVPAPTHVADLPSGYLRPREFQTIPLAFVDHYELPVPKAAAGAPGATSIAEALDDLPVLTSHLSPGNAPARETLHEAIPYRTQPHSLYAPLMRRWPGFVEPAGVTEHAIRRTPRDYETFRRMAAEDRYPEALAIAHRRFFEELGRLAADGRAPARGTPEFTELERSIVPPYPVEIFIDKWRKLNAVKPSWTIPAHLAKDAYSHIHHDSDQARAISIREAARIQSFPDAFRFTGNMGDCYRQVGNAVPPLLAWHIASEILRCVKLPGRRPNDGAALLRRDDPVSERQRSARYRHFREP